MMQFCFSLLLFCCVNLVVCSTRELAYVDLYAAFLLHPEMQRFHTPNFRFLRKPSPEVGQSLEEFEAARRDAMFSLGSRMSRYARELKISLGEINRELQQVLTEGGAGFRARMKLIRSQWQAEEHQKKGNLESEADKYYLTHQESKAKFVELWQEIRNALRSLQKRHRIMAFIPIDLTSNYDIPDVSNYKIDHQSLSGFRSPWETFYDKADQISSQELELRMRSYIDNAAPMYTLFSAFIPSWYLPSGGIDRTADLIRATHSTHEVPADKVAQVLEVYELWKNQYAGNELSIYQEESERAVDDSDAPNKNLENER